MLRHVLPWWMPHCRFSAVDAGRSTPHHAFDEVPSQAELIRYLTGWQPRVGVTVQQIKWSRRNLTVVE
jgi:hypothetical protein